MITKQTSNLLMIGSFLLVAIALFFPMDAFATANDLVKQTSNLSKQLVNIPKLIAMGAYVIGAFFAVRALFSLKGFIEAPDDNPITKVMGFAAVSALLILLPYIIGVATNSIGADAKATTSSQASFNDAGF